MALEETKHCMLSAIVYGPKLLPIEGAHLFRVHFIYSPLHKVAWLQRPQLVRRRLAILAACCFARYQAQRQPLARGVYRLHSYFNNLRGAME